MGKLLRKNNLAEFHEEDEFLYAIKESDEIEYDMYMRLRNGQTDPGENQNDNDNNENNDSNNDDESEDKNNNESGNKDYMNLGNDYISLF